MNTKYKKYSVEDFARDIEFVKWIRAGENSKKWISIVQENPELSPLIETARKIVESFQFSVVNVHKKDRDSVWKNIELFYLSNQKSGNKFRISKILLRYAAIVTFLLTIGGIASYFYFSKSNKSFDIESTFAESDKAILILPGGEEIVLKEKENELVFDATDEKIKINKDSIVDYTPEHDRTQMAQVVIPYGNRSDIVLPDGTKVWLNAGSRLMFPQKFMGKERHVYLTGEAYFDVFKNKNAPFIVTTDNIDVTVLGTEFNMNDNNNDGKLEVVLVEGGISMKENKNTNLLGKEIKLIPNQKAVYDKADSKIQVESDIDVLYYTSWKEGIIEFRGENIANVFKQLSRYYNVKFITEENVELNGKFGGKLDTGKSLNDVLKVIEDAVPITCRIEEDKVFINKKISNLPMR